MSNGVVTAGELDRRSAVKAAETQQFDVVIIGGGIFGACALWEATLRGLSALLVEAGDFASGVSANSFKIVHGGIRYLQHFDIPRVRASSRERRAFLTVAPHLVEPLPVLIPTYGLGKLGKPFLGTGSLLYDLLTPDKSRGISDPARRLPMTRFMNTREVLAQFPGLPDEGLTGACIFDDARFYNPTRLVLGFIRSAVSRGAVALNYTRAEELDVVDGRVRAVTVSDGIDGRRYTVAARAVLNAAGPWAERLLRRFLGRPDYPARTYSRDACFVIRRRFDSRYTLALQGRTHDPDALLSRPARHLFLSPWRDYTLVGVWHKVTAEDPAGVGLGDDEVAAFIDEVNEAFPTLNIGLEEVRFGNWGLVPFGENEEGSEHLRYGKRSTLTDHGASDSVTGLVTLIGVRYTMARGEAEKALDIVERTLGRTPGHPGSDRIPIAGGDFSGFDRLVADVAARWPCDLPAVAAQAVAHNHGSEFPALVEIASQRDDLAKVIPGTTVTAAEVVYSCRCEMVENLRDLVFRRTDIATAGDPGAEALQMAAMLAAAELGWDDTRLAAELEAVRRCFPPALWRPEEPLEESAS